MSSLCHALHRREGHVISVASPWCCAPQASGPGSAASRLGHAVGAAVRHCINTTRTHACHLYCNVLLADVIYSCVTEHRRLKDP